MIKTIIAISLMLVSTLGFTQDTLNELLLTSSLPPSFGLPYTDKFGRKNCTTGKPCGNSCINKNYVCHVNDPTPITLNKAPLASFTASSTTGIIPLTVNFNASSSSDSDGVVTTYSWLSSDGQVKNGQTASFVFVLAQNYTVTLTVSDNNGATSTKQINVSALPPPITIISETAIKPKPSSESCSNVSLVSVTDGDTIFVNTNGANEKVRISQIDAPEKSQDFGSEAKACLANILAVGNISICRDGKDKYGRTVANVYANSADVGHQLVEQGCAWAFTKYLEKDSDLPNIENDARLNHRGLWLSANPISPSEYRHGTVPVTVDSTTGIPVIPVTSVTLATQWNRIFDWAEQQYIFDLINGTSTLTLEDSMKYRCYYRSTDLFCVGVKDTDAYTYDGKDITNIGNIQQYLDDAQKDGF